MATNYEEECLQYASFENPLSFTEEEVEQMWVDRESTIPDKSTNQMFCARFQQMTLEVEERQRSNLDTIKKSKQDNILISRKKSTAPTT